MVSRLRSVLHLRGLTLTARSTMDVKQNRRTSDTLRRALVTVDSLVTVSTPSLDVNQETHSHLQRRGSTRTTSMVSSSDTSLHKLASFGYVDELVKRLPKTSNGASAACLL